MISAPFLIFSDLDGTLLDHETYSHDAADEALARLANAGIPVILASSKTAAEMIPIRNALGLSAHPAICENGAGLVAPGADNLPDTSDYHALRRTLDTLRAPFEGFSDMSVSAVATLTGLSPDAARLAKTRAFSEPGLWRGTESEKEAFLSALQSEGISAREGGRFMTLSFGATKADRMTEITRLYGAPPTLALGDAPNDLEMLHMADYGAIIANPHRSPLPRHPDEDTGRLTRSSLPGPAGWAERVTTVLAQHGILI